MMPLQTDKANQHLQNNSGKPPTMGMSVALISDLVNKNSVKARLQIASQKLFIHEFEFMRKSFTFKRMKLLETSWCVKRS